MGYRILLVLMIVTSVALAQPQQSANFVMQISVLNAGGTAGRSANFRLVSAFGQPSPVGLQSSAHFSLSGGFLSPVAGVSPLSPVRALVILQNVPNVNLFWLRVHGATSYKVYRDTTVLFIHSPVNLLGTTSDTLYVDTNITGQAAIKYYYIVTAVDDATASHVPSNEPAHGVTPAAKTFAGNEKVHLKP
jgi:hypothetical protein